MGYENSAGFNKIFNIKMEDSSEAAEGQKRKQKCCPSCQEPVKRLQLSVYGMPPERAWIPWLNTVNKSAGWSIRGFGQTGMNELQFLCFTSVCESCGLISWWDLSPEELERKIQDPKTNAPPIAFLSNPALLREVLNRLPENTRKFLQNLIDDLDPPSKNNEPKK